jgi:hypothetical protein
MQPGWRVRVESRTPDAARTLLDPTMPTEMHDKAHIDVFDRAAREHWALRFGVTEERLRKAVRMVGSRATSVAAYLGQSIR